MATSEPHPFRNIYWGHSVTLFYLINSIVYSTVTDCFGKGVFRYSNANLCFDLNLFSQNLWTPKYSDYQVFLYQTITEFREKGMNDVQIANWLNDNGYQTVRGSTFRNNHVHSIAKKRRRRLDILSTESKNYLSNIKIRYSGGT